MDLLGILCNKLTYFSHQSSGKFGVKHAQAFLSKIIFCFLNILSGREHIKTNITEIFLQDQSQL